MSPVKNALILTATIKSHILPTFYLGQMLAEEYKVHYLLSSQELVDMATEQGFTGILAKTYNIGFNAEQVVMNYQYYRLRGFKRWLKIIRMYFRNEIFKSRKEEIDEVMKTVQPDLVIIDVFSISNFIFFHSYMPRVKVLFFSPMLSTHTVKGFPLLSEGSWDKQMAEKNIHDLPFLKQEKRGFWGFLDYWSMNRNCRAAGVSKEHAFQYDNHYTYYYFRNIPELVLAPLELEVSPEVRKPNQYYLGLCTDHSRSDAALDTTFNAEDIKAYKRQGKKIAFCSFGSFFYTFEQHRSIATFITNVIEAVCELEDTVLVIASNQIVLDVIRSTVPEFDNVHLYSRVPQLQVLEMADVFITHGGLGSVKEAIEFKVPMMVYPLDYRWDNNGNAFKIAYYGLGLSGEMRIETPEAIRDKLVEILTTERYKRNMVAFGTTIEEKYTKDYVKDILNKLTA